MGCVQVSERSHFRPDFNPVQLLLWKTRPLHLICVYGGRLFFGGGGLSAGFLYDANEHTSRGIS